MPKDNGIRRCPVEIAGVIEDRLLARAARKGHGEPWGENGKIIYERRRAKNWNFERTKVDGKIILSCTLEGHGEIKDNCPFKENKRPAPVCLANTATANDNEAISFSSGFPNKESFLFHATAGKIFFGRKIHQMRHKKGRHLTVRGKCAIRKFVIWPILKDERLN